MNKFFLNFLFCFTIIHASELNQLSQLPVERLPVSDVAKQLAFWAPTAVAFETFGYFFDKVKPYQYNQSKTETWPLYLKKKFKDTPKFCFNSALSFSQCGIGYIGNQFVLNAVTVLSLQKPNPIEVNEIELLLKAYFSRENEATSPYQRVNGLFASMANSFNLRAFLKNGLSPLSAIPASAKIFVANFFLGNRFTFLKKIDLSFCRSMFLSFELAEYVIKGWSGQHHVNDSIKFSLHWLLAAPFFIYMYYRKNSVFLNNNFEQKSNNKRRRTQSFGSIDIRERDVVSKSSLQKLSAKKSFNNFSKNLDIEKDLTRKSKKDSDSVLLVSTKKSKKKELKLLNDDFVFFDTDEQRNLYDKMKTYLRQKQYFFYNIIALVSGLCFHALLDSGFYWYKQYQKV